jgi:hypothetical protein
VRIDTAGANAESPNAQEKIYLEKQFAHLRLKMIEVVNRPAQAVRSEPVRLVAQPTDAVELSNFRPQFHRLDVNNPDLIIRHMAPDDIARYQGQDGVQEPTMPGSDRPAVELINVIPGLRTTAADPRVARAARKSAESRPGEAGGTVETAEDDVAEQPAVDRATVRRQTSAPVCLVPRNEQRPEGMVSAQPDLELTNYEAASDDTAPNTKLSQVIERSALNQDVGASRQEIPVVRFTLPENLSTTLRPGSQTVMLRIEPKHLGPARLNLTLSGDKLRARLVVNNHAAKIAVESALDRLVEQLASARIEVDHIEVTVGGNSTSSGLFGRRPQWSPRRTSAPHWGAVDAAMSDGASAAGPVAGPVTYVGADGVNVLA